MGDRYIPGIGGGICQISTTLYTAVLKAELQVLERHNHGLPASYAVPGMDAAVAVEAAIDLRFRNNSANPIYIEAWAEEGTAEVKIYGTETRSSDRYVFFRTERSSWEERPAPVICEDGTKPAGYREVIEAGYQGGQIDTYKVISEGGRLTEEKISSSYYRSTPDRILVGTG